MNLGFAISELPDWLALLVGIAGLFTGGATGVARGSLKRMRLEDRRAILDQTYGGLDLLHISPERAERVQTVLNDAHRGLNVEAWTLAAFAAEVRTIERYIGYLPWRDRATWKRVVSAIEALPNDASHILNQARVALSEYFPLATRFKSFDAINSLAWVEAVDSPQGQELANALEEFESPKAISCERSIRD